MYTDDTPTSTFINISHRHPHIYSTTHTHTLYETCGSSIDSPSKIYWQKTQNILPKRHQNISILVKKIYQHFHRYSAI